MTSLTATTWRLDPDRSKAEFRTKTFWGLSTVRGRFATLEGSLDLRSGSGPEVALVIDAGSLSTRLKSRDKDLRAEDFFHVDAHPTVRFSSTSAEVTADGDGEALVVVGALEAAGRSVPLSLHVPVRRLGDELELEAQAEIPHAELGMTRNPLGMIKPTTKLLVTARLCRATE